MEKEQVAAVLDEIGTLFELQGENAFKCNAYHSAARTIEQLETSLDDVIRTGKLRELPGIGERMQENILLASDNAEPIMAKFVNLPNVAQVTGHGDTKSSIIVTDGRGPGIGVRMNADLRVVPDKSFAFALHYFTGSKEHNIAMRQRAI